MNAFTGWMVAGLIGVALMLSGVSYIKGRGDGASAERARWEKENFETLAESNDSLAAHLAAQNARIAELQAIEAEASGTTHAETTRIVERIKEIPVERIVKIAGDCGIDYGIIGMRNDWADPANRDRE